MHILGKRARARDRARPHFSLFLVLLPPDAFPRVLGARCLPRVREAGPGGPRARGETGPRRPVSGTILRTNRPGTIGKHW